MAMIPINGGDISTEAISGSAIQRPIIMNTFGKCDNCGNWDSGRTCCLAGAFSPMFCDGLYQPLGQLIADDDENVIVGKSDNADLVKAHVKAHTRTDPKTGAIIQVKEYDDARTKRAEMAKESANPNRESNPQYQAALAAGHEKQSKRFKAAFDHQNHESHHANYLHHSFAAAKHHQYAAEALETKGEARSGKDGGGWTAALHRQRSESLKRQALTHHRKVAKENPELGRVGEMVKRSHKDFLGKSDNADLVKSHVKAHTRKDPKTGKVVQVKDYEDARTKHPVSATAHALLRQASHREEQAHLYGSTGKVEHAAMAKEHGEAAANAYARASEHFHKQGDVKSGKYFGDYAQEMAKKHAGEESPKETASLPSKTDPTDTTVDYPAKIETSEKHRIEGTRDHGMELVHRGGKPSEYMHKVSYRKSGGPAAEAMEKQLHEKGYQYYHGYVDKHGEQFSVHHKQFPLHVGGKPMKKSEDAVFADIIEKSEKGSSLQPMGFIGNREETMMKSFVDDNADRIVAIALKQPTTPTTRAVAERLFKSISDAISERPMLRHGFKRAGINYGFIEAVVAEKMEKSHVVGK
jgi:hypothetical protein